MSDYYDTEAAHLAEIEDCRCDYDEPLSDSDKREYLLDKASNFRDSDRGKFIVAQSPRRNKRIIPILYLVDRSITKRFWWSHDAKYAMIFNNKDAAQNAINKLKFNNHLRILKI